MSGFLSTVFHDFSPLFVTPAEPEFGGEVTLRLRVAEKYLPKVKFVKIGLMLNGEQHFHETKVERKAGGFAYFAKTFELTEKVLLYKFIIAADDGLYFYNKRGLHRHFPVNAHDFKLAAGYRAPAWLAGETFYQIFPERFRNGDSANDVKTGEIDVEGKKSVKKKWDEIPGEGGWYEFYGGDLDGVTEKLDYIKELGCGAIYLNPIFTADSSHKYDCLDYFNVDKHFGGNEALAKLTQKAHEKGIKIMLDISINHTGRKHKWVSEHPEFYIPDDKGGFEAWNGVKSLLVLNYRSEELAEAVFRRADSALKKWLNPPYNIDGWRFDVGHNFANMKGFTPYAHLWREIREELRKVNPEAYLIGEHIADASEFLQGDMWDGAMNYKGFTRPLRKLMGDGDWALEWQIKGAEPSSSAEIFGEEVMEYYALLPAQTANAQFNLITCHDMDRFNSAGGYSLNKRRAAVMMMATFPGVMNVYYGDEIDIGGRRGSDAGRRFQMPWDESVWDKETLDFYKKITAFRKTESAIKNGAFMPLVMGKGLVSWARFDENSAVVTAYSPDGGAFEIDLEPLGSFHPFDIKFSVGATACLADNKLRLILERDGAIVVSLTRGLFA